MQLGYRWLARRFQFGLVRPGYAGLAQPAGEIGGKFDDIPGLQQRAGMGMGFLKLNELGGHGSSLL
jgi:hypothetical protein